MAPIHKPAQSELFTTGWTLAVITTGPLFRSINRHGQVQPGRLSGIDVARVVKKLANGQAWMRRSMLGTRCGPGTLPAPLSLGLLSDRS